MNQLQKQHEMQREKQQEETDKIVHETGNKWWRLMRPHTLTASFIPVAIGTATAYYYNTIHVALFIAMLVASMLIQAATNMFNEYYDYKRGLDTAQSVGIGGTIVRDGVAPRTILNLALAFYIISIGIGVYICMASSWWVAVIGLVSMAIGYLYTGGPLPIAYTPFGELFSGVFMGTIIIMITFFIQTEQINAQVFALSIPVALLIGAINMSNNIRDLVGDKASGRRTLAILLGKEKAVQFLGYVFIAAFGFMTVLVSLQVVPVWTLLVLLSAPKAMQAIKRFQGKTKPIEMMPAMKATAELNTLFGLLLTIGLLIGAWAA